MLSCLGLDPTVTARADAVPGLLARARAAGAPFGVLVLDHQLNDEDGLDAAMDLVLSQSPPPTIMTFTADASAGAKAKARKLGIRSWVVKPLRLPELADVLLVALGHKTVEEAMHDASRRRRAALPPCRVLVCDDNGPNRKVVRLFLKDTAATVETAPNGRVGLELFMTGDFDLVLMDMEMPVMDGCKATSAIRKWEQDQGRPRVPVIALTAHAFGEHRDRAMKAGCSDFVTKPIKKETLLAALEKHLGGNGKSADHGGDPGSGAPSGTNAFLVAVPEELKELVPMFMDSVAAELEKIRTALGAGDLETVRSIGHGLKGMGGTYGFDRVTDLGKALLDAAGARDLDEARRLVRDLDDYMQRVQVA
jgi:CheY-like chemotaxis protein/HPt (histidine-containing phosphotransfer) domain-containing protein